MCCGVWTDWESYHIISNMDKLNKLKAQSNVERNSLRRQSEHTIRVKKTQEELDEKEDKVRKEFFFFFFRKVFFFFRFVFFVPDARNLAAVSCLQQLQTELLVCSQNQARKSSF